MDFLKSIGNLINMNNTLFKRILNEADAASRDFRHKRVRKEYTSIVDVGYIKLKLKAQFSDYFVYFEVYDTRDNSLFLRQNYRYDEKHRKQIAEDLAKRIFVQIRSEIQEALSVGELDDIDSATNAFQKVMSAVKSFHLTHDDIENPVFEIFDEYDTDSSLL